MPDPRFNEPKLAPHPARILGLWRHPRKCAERVLGGPARLVPRLLAQIEAIQVHHLVPSGHKVLHEGLTRIITAIDFGERP